jgi:hypothetical protein
VLVGVGGVGSLEPAAKPKEGTKNTEAKRRCRIGTS